MFKPTTLLCAALAFLSVASASPVQIAERQETTYTTNMTTWIASGVCNDGTPLPGTVTSGQCFQFRGGSYQISALPDVDCTFSTYKRLLCQPEQLIEEFAIPAGNETVCAAGGVYDGGAHTIRSGIYNCA